MTKPKEVIREWIELINTEGRGLTKWEKDFMESITQQFYETASISDRQEEILETIYANKTS